MKLMTMDRELAERHYAEHTGKPFFDELVEFITSGPLLALVLEGEGEDPVVLGADTLVALDGRTLPKPGDASRAREWLEALSGRNHRVVGGICVRAGELDTAVVATDVRFRALDEATIAWYL